MHSKEHMCRATRHIPYPRYPTTELWQSLLCHGRCLTVSWRPRFAVDTRRVKRHEVQSAASRRQGPRDGKGFMAKLAMSATCNAKSAIVHTVSLSLSLFSSLCMENLPVLGKDVSHSFHAALFFAGAHCSV